MRISFLHILVLIGFVLGVDAAPHESTGGKPVALDSGKAWEAIRVFADEKTGRPEKRAYLELLRSPEEMPSPERPFGGPVRSGFMCLTVYSGIPAGTGVGQMNEAGLDTLEKCHAYLITELSGPYAAEAADALSKILGMCQPAGILNDPGFTAGQWEKLAARCLEAYGDRIGKE